VNVTAVAVNLSIFVQLKRLFLLPALITGLGLIPSGRVTAQTFTNLHSFRGIGEGANPDSELILSSNTLYGTTWGGGSSSDIGTVFAINISGGCFTNMHSFTGSDGDNPYAGLTLSGNTLYGTASGGGNWGGIGLGSGTVFAINTDGSNFRVLNQFTGGSDGGAPYGGLILSGSTLYGTAMRGTTNDTGTVVAIDDFVGGGKMILHTFTVGSGSLYTNSDGADPYGGLILSGNTLYGTAEQGGSSGNGTVFAVNTDSTGFTNLHSFTGTDGANPYGGLILSGNTLYGTSQDGGINGYGTVFAMNTNGMGFTNLHNFSRVDKDTGTNNDGANPGAGLILSGNTLYGTASKGGSSGNGTVFAINTDGTGFTNLHSFSVSPINNGIVANTNSDGANPNAGLLLFGNTLYGTARFGGIWGNGTVFSLSLPPPPLTIIHSATNVILTWPTYAPGITLQSTTNLVLSAVWNTNFPSATMVNGLNAVTNPISGPQQFFRLIQ
jgi:uncharacterized repeat protein (TIGR03803 family)